MASTISSVSPMQASIESATDALSIDQGYLHVPGATCLFSLLKQTLTQFATTYDVLPTSLQSLLLSQGQLERILNSIFDTSSLAFVTEQEFRIEAGLDDHDKATLFIQAVAGIAMIFERLLHASCSSSSSIPEDKIGCLFSRELQLFAESEQRRAMLDRIGHTSLLSHCYTKHELVSFLVGVVEGRLSGQKHVAGSNLPLNAVGEDLLSESVAWVSDRSCKNMGLPWGFTIMALN
ncbi:hypothetical protein B0T20DRAFT_490709 [Sordaria brevicollis]|uniref:Uncharacterized protein n=1 Tax=Sordaria brevicollis TaxID=83679 RepID=A0AAE0NVY8_SORBR|nr:hypothetical protein B0T20DRAFT_490709 [Sordaria brevicollis]